MDTNDLKYWRVIEKNTFYFFNQKFEEQYEGYLNSIKEILLLLKNDNENLKRITTLMRVVDDEELNRLVLKKKWCQTKDESLDGIKEWSDSTIKKMVKTNESFRKGLVNLFFEGATIPFLSETMPLFELKKLSISKLKFEIPEMIDTLIRYKEKGSYSGKKENNPEIIVEEILDELNIPFEKGDL